MQGLLRGYGGKNTSRIAEYIKNQLKEDQPGEQLVTSEVDLFKGGKQQLAGSYYTFDVCARNRGVRLHVKTPGEAGGYLLQR